MTGEYSPTMFVVFGVYALAIFSPFIVAVLLALRGGASVPRRRTFVAVATSMSYGAVVFGWLAVSVPIRLFVAYVYPALAASDPARREWEDLWILPLYRIGEFPQYVLPVALLTFACALVFYLWRRWPAIAKALA